MQRQIQQRRNIVDGSSGNDDIMKGFFANKAPAHCSEKAKANRQALFISCLEIMNKLFDILVLFLRKR